MACCLLSIMLFMIEDSSMKSSDLNDFVPSGTWTGAEF